MTWLGWLGTIWLVLSAIVTGCLIAFHETPDPLRKPEYDDEMGYRRKVKRLATDALGTTGDDAEIVRPVSCRTRPVTYVCDIKTGFVRRLGSRRIVFSEEMVDGDRKAPWETEDTEEMPY